MINHINCATDSPDLPTTALAALKRALGAEENDLLAPTDTALAEAGRLLPGWPNPAPEVVALVVEAIGRGASEADDLYNEHHSGVEVHGVLKSLTSALATTPWEPTALTASIAEEAAQRGWEVADCDEILGHALSCGLVVDGALMLAVMILLGRDWTLARLGVAVTRARYKDFPGRPGYQRLAD